jgi:prepilin-type N-terminal cleavage/methylation domain-containing protein
MERNEANGRVVVCHCQKNSAFSLLEVLIAAAVLVIVSSAVLTAFAMLQRNAADNRNYACAQIILQNAIDQSLTRGWDNLATPTGILAPTVPGSTSAYDASSSAWHQWDYYAATDSTAPAAVVTIYSDQLSPAHNVSGILYRDVQCVNGNNRLLWVTMRVDYTYAGRNHSQQMAAVRSFDE